MSYFGCNLKMTPELSIMFFQELRQPCNCGSDTNNTVIKLLTEMIPESA